MDAIEYDIEEQVDQHAHSKQREQRGKDDQTAIFELTLYSAR